MPEYLAPGVYVEEIDVGIRPIEGVSTSTAGMVGVTERGPVNVPILVTSYAEFERIFGGYLEFVTFQDACFLPHAVEGFFQNGGRRLFVTRVVADQAPNTATFSELTLFDRGESSGFADSRLLKHVRAGDSIILAESALGLADGDSIRVGNGPRSEYEALAPAGSLPTAADRVVGLRTPMYGAYEPGDAVEEVTLAQPALPADQYNGSLVGDHGAGEVTLRLDSSSANLAAGALLAIGAGNDREVLTVVAASVLPAGPSVTLDGGLQRDHAAGAVVQLLEDQGPPGGANDGSSTLVNAAASGDGLLVLAGDGTDFSNGEFVRVRSVTSATDQEFHLASAFHPMRLDQPLGANHPNGEMATEVTMPDAAGADALATTLLVEAQVGANMMQLAAAGDLAADQHVRVGTAPNAEFHTVANVEGDVVTLRGRLSQARPAGESFVRVTRTPGATTQLTQDASSGETTVFLADDGGSFAAGDLIQLGATDSATVEFRELAPATLGAVVLEDPLDEDHRRGDLFGRRDALMTVRALDPGDWGDQLRVSAENDTLLSTTVAANTLPGLPIPLRSTASIEAGTVLDFSGTLARVTLVDGNSVEVDPPLPMPVAEGAPVSTREFLLRIDWIKNGSVFTSETLRYLSLNPNHSRYVERIVGQVNGPLRPADRRPQGQSDLVRVDDLATEAVASTTVRVGPDEVLETLPNGTIRAASLAMQGGSNPLVGITNDTYIGTDDTDPDLRTGLHTMRNTNRVSMIAIPGRTEQDIQTALIDHCELMRYRMAVLDSLPGTNRTQGAELTTVQDQRNLYDTRYAALYYPWLVIRDPFPTSPEITTDLQVPPSGHMMGIYARTDIDRGVHKAPANVTVRGIRDLQRKLNKSEHDLLNPSPTNINVLRDFRDNGRGLRVWGSRCITADTDWKYVNVRRLFLFLEQSLDEGTQWVVFEPNDGPLWARVRQSITAFLTRVWRDGALQGATPEEAFFVKCDRSTMTQDDIDNGRMVVLIGVAPVKPAEFVIIRLFQSTNNAASQ